MKKISLLFSFCLLSFMAIAQGKFSFEHEEHDFGEVAEGTMAEHVFKFKNNGSAPIVITNVRASCGCTTPLWPKEPIMPGETGEIKAVYNSKNRPGNFYKTITVTSNASEPSKTLKIKGDVIMPASSAPKPGDGSMQKLPKFKFDNSLFDYKQIAVGEEVSKVFEFTNSGNMPLKIKKVYSRCNCVYLKSFSPAVAPGARGFVELTYKPTAPTQRAEVAQLIIEAEKQENQNVVLFKGKVIEDTNKSLVQESSNNPFGW